MSQTSLLPLCQRWSHRVDRYRPAGEPIDTSRYGVEIIPGDSEARDFVCTHHYSGSYPAARCRVGLYRTEPASVAQLVGVAVFSVPMQQAVVPKWLPGCTPNEGVELGRFVLLDDVPANGETWFLARAFKLLRAEIGVRGVLSCSDPMVRRSADGGIVLPGHVGTIYQAMNARHVGRTRRRNLVLDPAGRVVSERTISKLRNDERGRDYAERDLVAAGADPRRLHEDGRAWVDRVLADGSFRRAMHPGCLVYTWAFDKRLELLPAHPYPKARNALQEAK